MLGTAHSDESAVAFLERFMSSSVPFMAERGLMKGTQVLACGQGLEAIVEAMLANKEGKTEGKKAVVKISE